MPEEWEAQARLMGEYFAAGYLAAPIEACKEIEVETFTYVLRQVPAEVGYYAVRVFQEIVEAAQV